MTTTAITASGAPRRLYCSFRVDRHLFGVPVERVQEVLTGQQLTTVPLAPPDVPGLLNVRGQLVTVLDVRHRLLLGAADAPARAHVVLSTPGGPVSLLVDRVGEVLVPGEHCFAAPPETLHPAVRRLVTAVCKLDGQLMLVLDVDTTIALGGAA